MTNDEQLVMEDWGYCTAGRVPPYFPNFPGKATSLDDAMLTQAGFVYKLYGRYSHTHLTIHVDTNGLWWDPSSKSWGDCREMLELLLHILDNDSARLNREIRKVEAEKTRVLHTLGVAS